MPRAPPTVALVRERYSKWERRAPLTPSQVGELVRSGSVRVVVQPSRRRVFTDEEYARAGATVSEALDGADAVLGVKQVEAGAVLPGKTYAFFSHTVKAQPQNMALLDAFVDRKARLVDYECIRNPKSGERLVAFGDFAGRAGMVLALRALGTRLLGLGISSPFLNVASPHMYPSLPDAVMAVQRAGEAYRAGGGSHAFLPPGSQPLTFVFTGDGKVSKGAQALFRALSPDMLSSVAELRDPYRRSDPKRIYGVVVRDRDVVARRRPLQAASEEFDRNDYHTNPEAYTAESFATHVLPHTHVLVTGAYWDARFPRWVPNAALTSPDATRNLLVVCDAACDVGGSFEALHRTTSIESPFLFVDAAQPNAPELPAPSDTDLARPDVKLVVGVDILPSELPREASEHFGRCLMPFVPALASGADKPWTSLPLELANAVIAADGKLAPSYEYIASIRAQRESRPQAPAAAGAPQRWVEIKGHVFDTKLVNRVLDLVEARGARFRIVEAFPSEPRGGPGRETRATTTVILALALGEGGASSVNANAADAELDELVRRVRLLVTEAPPEAEAVMKVLPGEPASASSARARERKDVAAFSVEEGVSASSSSSPMATCVVVFGAGAVAAPAVERLSRDANQRVVVVSASQAELDAIAARFGNGNRRPNVVLERVAAPAPEVGKRDASWARELFATHRPTAAVSLLPQPLHDVVLRACLDLGGGGDGNDKNKPTPLVTASYASTMDPHLIRETTSRGGVVLTEMGLDPGIDHMSACAAIRRAHDELGLRVKSFESSCGGLPAPECADNALGYRLSWSPRGFLLALRNSARFLRDGTVVDVAAGGAPLLAAAETYRLGSLPSLALERLPNRDSLAYVDAYGLGRDACETVMRGTLRFEGFSRVMMGFARDGMLDLEPLAAGAGAEAGAGTPTVTRLVDAMRATMPRDAEYERALESLRVRDFALPHPAPPTRLDALCALFVDRLAMRPGRDRDMVVMEHRFTFHGSPRRETHTLVALGEVNGDTAMSRTVGLTAAVGVDVVLSEAGRSKSGLVRPTEPWVYEPALRALAREGIALVETVVQ